jgi:hypothetical protein
VKIFKLLQLLIEQKKGKEERTHHLRHVARGEGEEHHLVCSSFSMPIQMQTPLLLQTQQIFNIGC